MTATKIERMSFTQVDESQADSREQLALQAKELLGYKKLALAITTKGALLFALRKLEIEPLSTRSVEAYKSIKSKPGMWNGHRLGYIWMVVAACLFGISRYFGHFTDFNQLIFPNFAVWIAAVLGVISSIVALTARFDSDYRGKRTTYSWRQHEISSYAGTIPEFVLHKAIQIKREVPDAALFVEQLYEQEERHIIPNRDPFLVAKLGDECYYIEVWDEKEYEVKL